MEYSITVKFNSEAEMQAYVNKDAKAVTNVTAPLPLANHPAAPVAAAKPASRSRKPTAVPAVMTPENVVPNYQSQVPSAANAFPNIPAPGVQNSPLPMPTQPAEQPQYVMQAAVVQGIVAAPVQGIAYDRDTVIAYVSKLAAAKGEEVARSMGLASNDERVRAQSNTVIGGIFTEIFREMNINPMKVSDLPNFNLHDFHIRLPAKLNLQPAVQQVQNFV